MASSSYYLYKIISLCNSGVSFYNVIANFWLAVPDNPLLRHSVLNNYRNKDVLYTVQNIIVIHLDFSSPEATLKVNSGYK